MVAHDVSSSNKIQPTSTGYDNNYSLDNVEPINQGEELEIPKLVGYNEQKFTKWQLWNLQKIIMAWKPHYYNSPTWVFLR